MKIGDKIKLWLIPCLVYYLNILSTWWTRLKIYNEECLTDITKDTPILFAFWHGKLWLPANYFKQKNYYVLSSLSRDGEYMTRVLQKYGYQVIRGSSSRGGGRALLQLIRALRNGGASFITPDGPTGPIYKVKPGIVYLQEKSQGVIVPIGVAIQHKIVFPSWDKLIFPLPGSKAVLVYGQPIKLPLDKSIEERALLLETKINQVQAEAERRLAE